MPCLCCAAAATLKHLATHAGNRHVQALANASVVTALAEVLPNEREKLTKALLLRLRVTTRFTYPEIFRKCDPFLAPFQDQPGRLPFLSVSPLGTSFDADLTLAARANTPAGSSDLFLQRSRLIRDSQL